MNRRYYRRSGRMINGRGFWVCLALLLAVALLGVVMYTSTLTINVDERVLEVQGLPTNMHNLRIVYLSDIHYGRWFSQQRCQQLAQQISDLSADVVILGGDYGEDPAGAEAFFRDLPAIRTRNGIYAVVGDTDRSSDEDTFEELLKTMKERGVHPLVNDVADVKLGAKDHLYIVGSDDYRTGYPYVEKAAERIHADDFVIFVGHSPNLLPAAKEARDRDGNTNWFDLGLFGHTHGGQINLFGYTPIRILRPRVGNRYLSGWLEENRTTLLISNGVGTEGVPLRLFAPPQIHLIVLKQGR